MTTMGRQRAGCTFTEVPGGMMVSCSRSSSRPTCAYCKARPAIAVCDYPYRGAKAGQFCEGKLCAQCAYAVPNESDRHLCPPHKREHDRADKWLEELVAKTSATRLAQNPAPVGSREVTAAQAEAVPSKDGSDLDLRELMKHRIDSHDFDGDTCVRCNMQAMPDGTLEASCAETLQAQSNMYGIRPCPKCDSSKRCVFRRDVTREEAGEAIAARCTCDDCGHVADMRRVVLSEDFGHGYHFEGWLDVAPSSQPSQAQLIDQYAKQLADLMSPAAKRPDPPRNDPAINSTATIRDKVAHVRSAPQTREHHCHWPGCKKQVPPAKWGCLAHWRMLPKELQNAIWSAYRPGQENTLTPSSDYLEAAARVQVWISGYLEREATTPGEPRRMSWAESVRRTRDADRARPKFCSYCGQLDVLGHDRSCPQHPDPSAQAESAMMGDITESEIDPDVGSR